MKTYEIKLETLTLEAENLEQAKELAKEYFADPNLTIQKHEITEL